MSILLALAISACKPDEKPSEDTGEVTTTHPTLTLELEGIPTVQIGDESIPVQRYSPDTWDRYPEICLDTGDTYSYLSPDGKSAILTETTLIGNNFQTNQSQASFGCGNYKIPWYVLNGATTQKTTFDEDFKSEIESALSAETGNNVWLMDGYSIQMGTDQIWMPYEDGHVAGMLSVDLANHNYSVIWQQEIPNETDNHLSVYPTIQGDDLLLEIQTHKTIVGPDGSEHDSLYLSHTAVFDKNTRELRGFVEFPSTPEYYDATTIEGALFADFESYLQKDTSAPVVVDDVLWISHSPLISANELGITDIHTQWGPATLSAYDIPTGESLGDYRLDILGPTKSANILDTDLVATFGYQNPTVTTDGDDYYFSGDANIALVNASGEVEQTQDLGVSGVVFTTNYWLAEPRYPFFTDEGVLTYQDQTYEYQEGSYMTREPLEPEVDVSPFTYTYKEAPKSGTVEIEALLVNGENFAIDSTQPFQDGIQIYTGVARDYVVVDTLQKSAFYVQLPLTDPCYQFTYWDPWGMDPETEQFTGVYVDAFSCDLEAANAQVMGDQIYFGYDTEVFRTEMP